MITWSVPQCPFTIECSPRTLDDIRLIVTDAFFSLARGGLEVGGVLLGQFDGSCLQVLDQAALECEHAYGPSFTISPNDRARMRELLASAPASRPGLQVVGWYHSHTRSGIFLSEEDVDLHNRYFPEPWQIALVMKPHTFDPVRLGFFFREADGTVHATESYNEFELESLPVRQVPVDGPGHGPSRPLSDSLRGRPLRRLSQLELEMTAEPVPPAPEAAAPVVARVPVRPMAPPPPPVEKLAEPKPKLEVKPKPEPLVRPKPEPVVTPKPEPLVRPKPEPEVKLKPEPVVKPKPEPVVKPEPATPVEHRLPSFAVEQEPTGRGRVMIWAVLGAAATLGLIFGAVKTREMWMSKLVTAVRPQPLVPLPPPSMGLKVADHEGQLEIDWDRLSLTIRQGSTARLEISDGGPAPQSIPLDGAHLQAGVFTYGRQSEKVDVKLIVRNTDGKEASEATTYMGKLPVRKPPEENEEVKKAREELAAQTAKMKADLNWQAMKTKKLEKQLNDLRQQQQKRMQNQAEGK